MNVLMSWALTVLGGCMIGWGAHDLLTEEKPDLPPLAERINGACKKGYAVQDFFPGGDPMLSVQGVVQVTCASQGDDYKTYTVAVVR